MFREEIKDPLNAHIMFIDIITKHSLVTIATNKNTPFFKYTNYQTRQFVKKILQKIPSKNSHAVIIYKSKLLIRIFLPTLFVCFFCIDVCLLAKPEYTPKSIPTSFF